MENEFSKFKEEINTEDAEVQFSIGNCYKKGQDVPRDYEEAVKWYTKAAKQGHAAAQCDLGFCYAVGHGVEQQ